MYLFWHLHQNVTFIALKGLNNFENEKYILLSFKMITSHNNIVILRDKSKQKNIYSMVRFFKGDFFVLYLLCKTD